MKLEFDTIIRDAEKKIIIIKGWGLDNKNVKEIDIEIEENSNVKAIIIKKKYRGDVNSLFGLSPECCCGFIIAIKFYEFEGDFNINYLGGIDSKKIEYSVSKKVLNPKYYGSPYYPYYMLARKSYNYVKRSNLKNILFKIKNYSKKQQNDYTKWIRLNEKYNTNEVREKISNFNLAPKISILLPVYNVDEKWLRKAIDSVKNQVYPNWELCIADDMSTEEYIKPLLENYEKNDERIKVVFRSKNGHISEASNSALELATGDFVGLLDHDDELSPYALFEVAQYINKYPKADLIYSDEDKISEKNKRSNPFFKSDWAPDTLMSINYICHFSVYRKIILENIGGFRKGYEGAQDYDLVLRFTESTNYIYHIPKILYHWRMVQNSTALKPSVKNYAYESGVKAVDSALKRRGIKGTVKHGAFPGIYDIEYKIIDEKKVSIIIPTRDGADDLKLCIESILEKTIYSNYEIIIADNGSEEKETFELFRYYEERYPEVINIQRIDIPFNYAKINNLAVDKSKGEILLFLNNDTTVITKGWLKKMVGVVQQDHVGAVGAKLYYPDNSIQHSGVVVGLGGVAGHIHYGFPKEELGYFGKLAMTGNYLAVTGACLMIKKSDFIEIEGFDEEYAVAFNDVDLCVKLYDIGKTNVWMHDVELYHYESKSRGYEETYEQKKRFGKEIDLFQKKWMKYIIKDPFYNENLSLNKSDFSINLFEKKGN